MNSRELLYDSLEGLTRPKGLLKHREIPRFKSFLKRSVEVLGFICHEGRSTIALGLVGLV